MVCSRNSPKATSGMFRVRIRSSKDRALLLAKGGIMTRKQMIKKQSNFSGKWLHASSKKLERELAEILIKIAVFFVRALFIVVVASVLITRAAFA